MPTPTCSTVKSSAASSISQWHSCRLREDAVHSPALVLVHGGQHSADCWDLTVDELHRRAPHLPVLAVDMPGHGTIPGDLTTVSIADCVRSAVEQIEDAGLGDVIVVGHSLAGLTVPGMVAELGSPRVREMVLAACLSARSGQGDRRHARWAAGLVRASGGSAAKAAGDDAEYAERVDLLQRHDARAAPLHDCPGFIRRP